MANATKKVVSFATNKIILIMMMTVLTVNGWGQSSTACASFPDSLKVPCDLVGNGNFEHQTTPITAGGHLEHACPWFGTFTNGGYFNVCIQKDNLGTASTWTAYSGVCSTSDLAPEYHYALNYQGKQSSCDINGFAQVGEAYAGFKAFKESDSLYLTPNPTSDPIIAAHNASISASNFQSFATNSHTYISQKLPCKLHKGVPYDISFWVSLGDFSSHATNHLGMFLSHYDPSDPTYFIPEDRWKNDASSYHEGQMAHTTTGGLIPPAIDWLAGDFVIPQVTQTDYGLSTGFITTGHSNTIAIEDSTGWIQITTGATPFVPTVDMEYITIGDFGTMPDHKLHVNDPAQTNSALDFIGAISPTPTYYPDLMDPSYTVGDHAFYYVDEVSITPHNGSYPTPVITTETTPCLIHNGTQVTYNFSPSYTGVHYDVSVSAGGVPLVAGVDYNLVGPMNIPCGCQVNTANGTFVIEWINGIPSCSGATVNLTMKICDCSVTGSYDFPNCCPIYNPQSPVVNLGSFGDNPIGSTHYVINNATDVMNGGTGTILNDGIENIDAGFVTGTAPGSFAITNKTFTVNGIFTVDNDLTLNECDVSFAADAKIIVLPCAKFKINSSHLHACKDCEQMWEGIEVQGVGNNTSSGQFPGIVESVNYSIIEDAKAAITSQEGGGFNIDLTVFNRNYKGLVVSNYSGDWGVTTPYDKCITGAAIVPHTITNNVFTCRDFQAVYTFTPTNIQNDVTFIINNYALMNNDYTIDALFSSDYSSHIISNYANGHLFAPYLGFRSYTGIEVYGLTNFSHPLQISSTLGAVGSSNYNFFDYMDFGIRSIESNLNVYYSIFMNIRNLPNHKYIPNCAAIWAKNISKFHILRVGGSLDNEYNRFYECTDGVNSTLYNNHINYNLFLREYNKGILVQNGKQEYNEATNNTMYNMNYGIHFDRLVDGYTAIDSNYIEVNAQVDFNSTLKQSFGILATNTHNDLHHVTIDHNVIKLQNITSLLGGFHTGQQTTATGIWMDSDDAHNTNFITNNDITMQSAYYTTSRPPFGIRLQATTGTEAYNNTISNDWTATPNYPDDMMGISTENSPISYIHHNTTNYMGSGISALGTCQISQYYCNDLEYSYDGFMFYSANIPNQMNNGNGTGNVWNASVDLDLAGNTSGAIDWNYTFYPSMNQVNSLNITRVPVALDGCSSPGAGGGGNGGGGGACCNEMMRESMLGKIVRGQNTYDTLQPQFLLRDSIFCFNKLRKMDTLLHLNTTDDTLYQNFFNYCQYRNIGQFEDVNSLIIDSVFNGYETAKQINENIPTVGTMQDNEKLVNRIYLTKLAYEADTLNGVNSTYELDSTQVLQLQGVAYQNPLLGGNSVYLARLLLWIDVADDKSLIVKSLKHPGVHTEKNYAFNLFPNPNNGSMTLEYKLAENEIGQFGIYTVSGKTIKKFTLNNATTSVTIDESDLAAGVYVWGIKVNNQLVKMDKLVIIK